MNDQFIQGEIFEWNKIDEIMKKWQDKSISFLIKALNC